MTKNDLMELVRSGRANEAFTHTQLGTFDVTAMRKQCPLIGDLVRIPLHLIIDHIKANRVFEQSRIDAIRESEARADPGIFIITMEGGVRTHTMIDGHHRAMKLHALGAKYMHFYEVPIEKAIRPRPGFVDLATIDPRFDWGDRIVDGKIVRKEPQS